MDTRQQIAGTLPSQHSLQLASHSVLNDDFFPFDTNFGLPPSMDLGNFEIDISSNVSELASLLEFNSSNASDSNFGPASLLTFPPPPTQSSNLLPADEGSGTTNTVPGSSSSQHHCRESSSAHQSRVQTLQPVERPANQSDLHPLARQVDSLCSAAEQSINPQYRDLKEANRPVDCHLSTGIVKSQSKFEDGNRCLAYSDALSPSSESTADIPDGVQRNRLGLLEKGESFRQPSCPSQEATAVITKKLSLQEHNPLLYSAERHKSNGIPSVDVKKETYQQTDQGTPYFPRQLPSHHSRPSDSLHMGSLGVECPKAGLVSNNASSVSQLSNISDPHLMKQVTVASESRVSNVTNEAAVQSQKANLLLQAPGSSSLSNCPLLLQPQADVGLPSLQSQSPHQQHITNLIQRHGNADIPASGKPGQTHPYLACEQLKFPQGMSNQSGYLPAQQSPFGTQHSMCRSSQQPSYHLVRSEPFGGSQNASNFIPGAQQVFPGIQSRFQSLIPGLKVDGRHRLQPIPISAIPVSGRPADAPMRRPVPPITVTKCEQLLMQYIQEQRRRPSDNNIQFWRDLVQKFFSQGAVKRWCLTSYNSSAVGRHAQGLFPMDYWFCNLCGVEPGRGFESSTDVLPRLFKIKYDSGLLDEVLFLDLAEERYMLSSGKIVLEYSKAVHESVFSELRVVRYGKLRVSFCPSLKIFSWEFCTKAHEEVVPRKNLLQQVHQLTTLANKVDQDENKPESLKSHCTGFTLTASNLAVKLDAPMVNDLGFSKRYVRCLQIAEVVNNMRDLVSFDKRTGLGPIRSLAAFPATRKAKTDQSNAEMLLKQVNHNASPFNQEYHASCSPVQSSPVSQVSVEKLNHITGQVVQSQGSNVPQCSDSLANPSHLPNQLQSQARSQMEVQLSRFAQPQTYGSMQPPVPSQLQSLTLPEAQLAHQSNSESVAQGSQTLSQVPSEHSSLQGFNQQYPQIYSPHIHQSYQQHSKKQFLHQASSQMHLMSQSGNFVDQRSVPGTPQSEISDMRSNA